MPPSVTITGVPEMQQRLQEISALVVPILGLALQQEADTILEVSQTLVPVDTGALKRSGLVGDVQLAGPQASVDITYGGGPEDVQYAVYVEFDVTMNHPRGGQAHYLGEPFRAATATLLANLADALRAAL